MPRMADEQSKRLRGGGGAKEGDDAGGSGRSRTGANGDTEDEYRAAKEKVKPGEEDDEEEEDAGSSDDDDDEEEDDDEDEEEEEEEGGVVVKEGKRGGVKPPFEQGEKVLAYHGDLLYYAKVLEVETDALGRSSFFIHYMGWKKSWDEWVGTERLLKDSPANQRKKTELEKGHHHGGHASADKHKKAGAKAKEAKGVPAAKSAKGRQFVAVGAVQGVTGANHKPGRGRKRGRDVGEQVLSASELKRGHASPQDTPAVGRGQASAQEGSASMQEEGGERGASDASPGQAPDTKGSDGVEQGSRRHVPGRGLSKEAVGPELSISIPLPLKKQLVADEKMIVHKGELLELPARPTVQEILDRFLEQRGQELTASRGGSSSGGAATSLAQVLQETEDVINALRDYFDRTLALMLLYRQERQQYMDHFPAAAAAQAGSAAGPATLEDTGAKAPPAAGRQAGGGASTPSLVYGGEHLLRLFTKLPSMLSYLDMEEDTRSELQAHLSMLLKFMVKNQSWIFPGSPRYTRVEEHPLHNGPP